MVKFNGCEVTHRFSEYMPAFGFPHMAQPGDVIEVRGVKETVQVKSVLVIDLTGAYKLSPIRPVYREEGNGPD